MTRCVYPHRPLKDEHSSEHGFLCRTGYARLKRALAETGALHTWLHANLPGGSGGGFGTFTTGSPSRPLPIRTNIADHLALITDTLNSWARNIAEERNLYGPWRPLPQDGNAERDRLRRAVEQTCSLPDLTTFLLAQLPWSVEQSWVDDYATEVEDLHRTAHSLAPSRPARHRVQAPCPDPDCNLTALVRVDGSAYVECEGCGRLWTEEEWLRLAIVLADGLEAPKVERHSQLSAATEGQDARTGRREAS